MYVRVPRAHTGSLGGLLLLELSLGNGLGVLDPRCAKRHVPVVSIPDVLQNS